MQCLFYLRFGALLLLIVAILTFAISPSLIMTPLGEYGIRLHGGGVAPLPLLCPVMAIISAYTFLHSLESRVRAAFFFLAGLGGTLATQSRGAEIALLLCLLLTATGWVRTNRRAAYLVISGFAVSVIFGGALVGVAGGGRVWNAFNRGQSVEGIATASGRTQIWKFVIQYCMSHPQGMGYVAGFRAIFREYFAFGLDFEVSRIGNTHNTFLQFLADAGWLAMAIYLIMLVRVIALGMRFATRRISEPSVTASLSRHALRCALLLLIVCLLEGMDGSDFAVPLRVPFYFQNLIIAIILALCARMIAAARSSRLSWPDSFHNTEELIRR